MDARLPAASLLAAALLLAGPPAARAEPLERSLEDRLEALVSCYRRAMRAIHGDGDLVQRLGGPLRPRLRRIGPLPQGAGCRAHLVVRGVGEGGPVELIVIQLGPAAQESEATVTPSPPSSGRAASKPAT